VSKETRATWEFKEVALPRDLPREEIRQMLTASIERGNWELDQSRIFRDGRRRVRLRRRVYRVVRTA
jgi:hypothetical protein